MTLVLALAACVPDTATNPPPGGTAAAKPAAAAAPPPWIGIFMRGVEFEPTAATGGTSRGALIDAVIAGSPAELAGLREGDIVVSLAGGATGDPETLVKLLAGKAGTAIPIDIVRDGRREAMSLTPIARPENANERGKAELSARLADSRAAARAAESANDLASAFRHYATTMRFAMLEDDYHMAGPEITAVMDETLARMAASTTPRPRVPSEAERHNRRAIAILKTAATDQDNDRAYAAFREALHHAPWVPDLWLNAGLVLDKGGYSESAQRYLRRYLILYPTAPDAAAVRQKMAELDVLIEDVKPWRAYANLYPFDDGHRERISLRGRTLTVTADTDSPAGSPRKDKAGDLIAQGTIRGRKAVGKWIFRQSDPDTIRCFAAQWEEDAEFTIGTDGKLTITTTSPTYNPQSCAVTGRNQFFVTRTYPRPN